MRIGLTLGLAAAAVVAGGVFASAGGSAPAADCSKVAAREVVERLRLGDPTVVDPVGKVLCGAFTGPGSQVMVVMLRGPGNTGFVEWAVVRWAGDAWQFLMKQPAGASITAAGSDIRQTLPIYRLSDARCCPTGGTKTRLWHWAGTRFVAEPWRRVTKPSRFDSPSRNIHCWMYDDVGDYRPGVGCQSDSPRKMVHMNVDGRLRIGGIPASWCGCDEPDFPPLAYGKQVTVGRLRCDSLVSGVRCIVVQSGMGFLMNRDGVSRVGA